MSIQGKVWGQTASLFNKNNVEIHRIEIKKGFRCSKHTHAHKFNMFIVESGSLEIDVWKSSYDLIDTTRLGPQQSTVVPPGEAHLFRALENTVAYEVYWVELSSSDIKRDDVGGEIDES